MPQSHFTWLRPLPAFSDEVTVIVRQDLTKPTAAQSSQDVLIENVFIRSDDDSVAVKGQYPAVDTANLLVRDSVLWNQRFGNCMEIGFELFNAAIYNRACAGVCTTPTQDFPSYRTGRTCRCAS